jgi:hypothetical protein
MNLGENGIGMRILRLARSADGPHFPHSQAIPDRVHNTLYAGDITEDRQQDIDPEVLADPHLQEYA